MYITCIRLAQIKKILCKTSGIMTSNSNIRQSLYSPTLNKIKDKFYFLHDQLPAMPAITPASASLIPYGDCNGHGGRTGSGYKEVHGNYGYDKPVPDIEGDRILEYAY